MQFVYVVLVKADLWAVSRDEDTLRFFKSKDAAVDYARTQAHDWRPSAIIQLDPAGALLEREDFE